MVAEQESLRVPGNARQGMNVAGPEPGPGLRASHGAPPLDEDEAAQDEQNGQADRKPADLRVSVLLGLPMMARQAPQAAGCAWIALTQAPQRAPRRRSRHANVNANRVMLAAPRNG